MSLKFRLCKNDTTTWLRETFSATPLKVPEARIQPLTIMAYKNDEANFRGQLRYLLQNTDQFNPPVETATVANVSLQRTKKVNIDLGLSILDGFFKALKMDNVALGATLKGVKEMSLSFTNVKRLYVDLGALGQSVKNNRIDLSNPSIGVFTGDKPADMLVISDAIVSPGFTINNESGREDAFDVNVPLVEKYIADAKLNVKVEKSSKNSISFEGQEPLTFAFSCVRVLFDSASGALSLMETVNPKRDTDPDAPPVVQKMVLDDDLYEPAMLSLD
ncbi:MAG TPA: hypothetical protein VGD35_02965 [Chitinophaga sp.]